MLAPEIVKIPYEKPRLEGKFVLGTIPILDVQYGNIWTNIDDQTFQKLGVKLNEKVSVEIQLEGKMMWRGQMPYVHTFGEVPLGEALLYLNSLLNVSFALNQDSFAARHKIGSGPQWRVKIEKVGN